MNVRKFKSDKNALIAEGNRIVSSSDDAKFIRKVTIVNLLLRGVNAKSLADASGETDRTLSNWVRSVDEYGFEALRPRKQPGRPQSLTNSQKEKSSYLLTQMLLDIQSGMGHPYRTILLRNMISLYV